MENHHEKSVLITHRCFRTMDRDNCGPDVLNKDVQIGRRSLVSRDKNVCLELMIIRVVNQQFLEERMG